MLPDSKVTKITSAKVEKFFSLLGNFLIPYLRVQEHCHDLWLKGNLKCSGLTQVSQAMVQQRRVER